MGYLFDERKFINDNATWIDNHLNSQYSRFLDAAPTYVTYYNINNIESTVDFGFKNVEKVLGDTSPLRFNKVTSLPIYGIDQINPSLDEGEEGLNYSFDGTAVTLPSTIKPYPNDFFTIEYLGPNYIFMVTSVDVDGIRDEGYNEIGFTLKYVDSEDKYRDLERQSTDDFECFVKNIGTEEKVLIRSADVESLNVLNQITTDISKYYLILFYDKKYNSFLFNRADRTRLYDRLLTHFINKNRVFFRRNEYNTILLTVEDPNRLLEFEYHNSFYRAIEEQKPELIKPMFYGEGYANDPFSIFQHWGDSSVFTTFFNGGTQAYINAEHIEVFKDAKSFYMKELPKVENDTKMINISIPVGNNDVFTQDAGYNREKNKTELETLYSSSDVMDGPTNRLDSAVGNVRVNKNKLLVADIYELMENPVEEEPVIVHVEKPEVIVDISQDHRETTINGTVEVTNMVDKILEHITKSPEGMDVVGRTITMYLSGNVNKLSELEITELKNYADYMRPTRESFILIPVLLFVLESYYKSSVSNK